MTTEASKLLKIKNGVCILSQKRTDFGVEKALFLGKKRPFLTSSVAVSSLLRTLRETENGAAEARLGFAGAGEALPLPSGRTAGPRHMVGGPHYGRSACVPFQMRPLAAGMRYTLLRFPKEATRCAAGI